MEFILNSQGDALNKFQALRVDYFDKQKRLAEFKELVTKPVAGWKIEFTERAVDKLYEWTAGNPYFTKLLCRDLLKLMVERRDSHITENEVVEAVAVATESVGTNSFMHFWKDGIVESGEKVEEISSLRRPCFCRSPIVFGNEEPPIAIRFAKKP